MLKAVTIINKTKGTYGVLVHVQFQSSSSSLGAKTLGGFWPAS
jgi:hypothetical protein